MEKRRWWEFGYNGDGENPHTENIERLKEYIEILEEMKEDIE